MKKEHSTLHLSWWCGIPIALSFILSVIGSFLPQYSPPQNLIWQIATVAEMVGFSCLAFKASKGEWYIPAAGFVLMAIAQGVFFSSTQIHIVEVNYEQGASGIMFMIPGILMVNYCTLFPRWLRWLGFAGILPMVYVMILIYNQTYHPNSLIENAGFIFFQLSTLGWAWYFWKDERKEE